MRHHHLNDEQLSLAVQVLGKLAVEVADIDPTVAACILDAADLCTAELHARAFGGGADAHEHAQRALRERSNH